MLMWYFQIVDNIWLILGMFEHIAHACMHIQSILIGLICFMEMNQIVKFRNEEKYCYSTYSLSNVRRLGSPLDEHSAVGTSFVVI